MLIKKKNESSIPHEKLFLVNEFETTSVESASRVLLIIIEMDK